MRAESVCVAPAEVLQSQLWQLVKAAVLHGRPLLPRKGVYMTWFPGGIARSIDKPSSIDGRSPRLARLAPLVRYPGIMGPGALWTSYKCVLGHDWFARVDPAILLVFGCGVGSMCPLQPLESGWITCRDVDFRYVRAGPAELVLGGIFALLLQCMSGGWLAIPMA